MIVGWNLVCLFSRILSSRMQVGSLPLLCGLGFFSERFQPANHADVTANYRDAAVDCRPSMQEVSLLTV